MADETITDLEDKPSEAPIVEGAAPSPADADKAGESYMLDFANREKAEAGFKEVQAAKTRAEQTAAELKATNEKLQQEVLMKMSEAITAKESPTQTTEQRESEIKAIAESLQDGSEEDIVKFVLDTQKAAIEMAGKQSQESSKSTLEAVEALKASISELKITSSPSYQAQKDLIDNVVEQIGLTPEQAIALVDKGFVPKAVANVPADPPPGSIGSDGRVGTNDVTVTQWTDAEKAGYLQLVPDATPEDIEREYPAAGRRS